MKIPKEKIVVFTRVSGSGKSSIVFDTVAAVLFVTVDVSEQERSLDVLEILML